MALAALLGSPLTRVEVESACDRLDGWPLPLRLALQGSRVAGDLMAGVIERVVDELPSSVIDGAMALSVVEAFDGEMARELVGADTDAVIASLHSHRLVIDGPDRAMKRIVAPVRAALAERLDWSSQGRSDELHRRAAKLYERRHQLNAGYQQLVAIGDIQAARALVMTPTFDLVDRGDRAGLLQLRGLHPTPGETDDAGLALDLALATFFAGDRLDARRWTERAQEIGALDGGRIELQLRSTSCVLDLMDGEIDRAADAAAAFIELNRSVPATGPIEWSFATVEMRLALLRGDVEGAEIASQRARAGATPETVLHVTLPALHAWLDLSTGRVERAKDRIDSALTYAGNADLGAHHGAFDLLVSAAWTYLVLGELHQAGELASAASTMAESLRFDWNRVRAGVVMAHVRSTLDGPDAGLDHIRRVRRSLDRTDTPLASLVDATEVRLLTRLGRLDIARDLERSLAAAGPSASLARAALALARDRPTDVCAHVDRLETWPVPDQIEAAILLAAADDAGTGGVMMRRVLTRAASIGIVSPFLWHAALLRQQVPAAEVQRLHPQVTRLQAVYSRSADTRPDRAATTPLTTREMSIVRLLSTHLTYAEMGERLYVSVNTVKSNLKSIYRKLGVTTRSDAVDRAREAGLL
jgi:LuxR family maltose regulon positive regulatory protein